MIDTIMRIFTGKKEPEGYEGLSDFFLRAPEKEKKAVIKEAARKANEDQLKVFTKARLKTRAN